MAPEEMGKVSQRVRIAFAVSSVIFLAVLAVSPIKDTLREWRRYKRDYVRFAQTRPDSKRLLADYQPNIEQVWIPTFGVVDRCVTCHQGLTQASLQDDAVPKVFRAHPVTPHTLTPNKGGQWGCVVCHRGQGRATEVSEAHLTTLAWERPLLPIRYIQASCGACHQDDLQETPQQRGATGPGPAQLRGMSPPGRHRPPGDAGSRLDRRGQQGEPGVYLQMAQGSSYDHR